MAIQSVKLGPGTLTFGAQDATSQVTNCRVEWSENVTAGDVTPVLSGEELRDDDQVSYTATLAGNVIQDILTAGFLAYTWANKGVEVAVDFVPNTVDGRKVTGTVRISPVNLGGDVKTRNKSDFSFAFVGDPVLGDVV